MAFLTKQAVRTAFRFQVGKYLSAFCLASSIFGTGAMAAETYRLSAQDKLRIGVVEWLPGSGDMRSPISGEFSVSSSGTVSLPLLGDVPAAGSTPDELAHQISEKLAAKLGMEGKPNTSVEVVQFRPFYIVGSVERAGEFAYRPRMTVLQAVSLAGGLQRPSDNGLLQLKRDAATAQEDVNAVTVMIDEFTARQARLMGELNQSKAIEFPSEFLSRKSNPRVARLIQLEQILFESRRRLFESGLDAKKKLVVLLGKELQSQQSRMATLKKEYDAMERQLQSMEGMTAKGLAAPGRLLDLVRGVSEISGKIRELDVQSLRTQQEIVTIEQSLTNGSDTRQQEVGAELVQVKGKLTELWLRFQTDKQLIDMAEGMAGREGSGEAQFTLVRDASGTLETIADATEETLLNPGDVLKVQSGGGARVAASRGRATIGMRLPAAVSR